MKVYNCKHCGTECKKGYSKLNKFCSNKCQGEYSFLTKTVVKFLEGLIYERATIRKILIHLRGDKCEECNITDWNGRPITFQVDHIDGNASNNMPTNVRLVCPNCHSQTDTWGAKNKGNGRASRGLPLN